MKEFTNSIIGELFINCRCVKDASEYNNIIFNSLVSAECEAIVQHAKGLTVLFGFGFPMLHMQFLVQPKPISRETLKVVERKMKKVAKVLNGGKATLVLVHTVTGKEKKHEKNS